MIKNQLKKNVSTIVILGALLLTACGGGEPEPTPTLSIDQIQTQVVETFSAALTQTALAAPSDTPVPTLTPSPTLPPLPTSTGGVPFGGATVAPTASCYRLAFVSDVSIPDNTNMTPGQTFTKTWKVRNTGSCAWDAGFKFSFTGGDAMNGSTYTLPSAVPANAEIDISIAMIAPTNKTGSVRGNWRMSTAVGQFFGDEVYVMIVVGGTTTTNTSAAATNTSAPATATPTPTSTTESSTAP
jgi:hypothetical protein